MVENLVEVICEPAQLVSRSLNCFVVPYRVLGFTALSVLIFKNIFGLFRIAVLIKLTVPLIFVSIVSMGLNSEISRFFIAAV